MNEENKAVTIAEIRDRYVFEPVRTELAQQQKILDESYRLVTIHKNLIGEPVTQLARLYRETETLNSDRELSGCEKQTLLYHIFDEYFGLLAKLSWKKRRAIKADKMIRRMKKCLSRRETQSANLQYWIDFCKIAVPFLIAALGTELWGLELHYQGSPLWQLAIVVILCLLSFSGYFYSCYHLEGRRLYGDLQGWIHYRQNPQGHNRPVGLFQILKLVLPPLATIGGALLKIYYQ